MAFGMPTDQRGQIMVLLVLLAGAGGYGAWNYLIQPNREEALQMQREADSLQVIVDAAKRDLASGTVEDLRRKVAEYSGHLELMRQLVPGQNEVPALIDDISTRAKIRGVTLGTMQPLSPEPGAPFDMYRYRFEVFGHFDQVGEFLADIASLKRIIVPVDVSLKPANQASQRLLGDTLGALLVASFEIKTYVKSTVPTPAGGGGAQ